MFTTLLFIIAGIALLPLTAMAIYHKYIIRKPAPLGLTPFFTITMGTMIGLIAYIFTCFVTIEGSNYGVVKRFGKIQPAVLTPGLYWQMPAVDKIDIWDGAMRKLTETNDAASRDLQQATVQWVASWHYEPNMIPRIAEKTGIDSGSILVAPAINETLKAVTALYKAEELITQRENVRNLVVEGIRKRLHPYGIRIDEFNITNFKFGEKFSEAVEAKTEAEQLVLKTRQDAERTKIEMEQKITRAEAEARSLRLQKEAITPELLELRKIERDIKAIDKWDGVLPKVTGGASPFVDIKTLE